MRSKVSKLVVTCWQVEKWLKGLKRQKYFFGFADGCKYLLQNFSKINIMMALKTLKVIDEFVDEAYSIRQQSRH
jgi:hypothetical protein